jgi:low affinity Fe/Cu permease
MEKSVNPTREHFKAIGFVLVLVYLFLGLFVFISGRLVGFSLAIGCCAGLAIVVTIVFMSIVLCNIISIGILKIKKHLSKPS